ncbi:MAG: hypothetical protein M0R18_00465 [Deltaproteobacteria bacterium]|jgi:hypothetical protein|nr:hypothetical protein [Deltaproteobacteria bacterium]MDX9760983.1 hypothetical protein [Desulfomonilia bacterium]
MPVLTAGRKGSRFSRPGQEGGHDDLLVTETELVEEKKIACHRPGKLAAHMCDIGGKGAAFLLKPTRISYIMSAGFQGQERKKGEPGKCFRLPRGIVYTASFRS